MLLCWNGASRKWNDIPGLVSNYGDITNKKSNCSEMLMASDNWNHTEAKLKISLNLFITLK